MELQKNSINNLIIQSVQFALEQEVLGFLHTAQLSKRSVAFSQGQFNDLYATPGTATFSQQKVLADAGPLYEQRLELFYPGMAPERNLDLLFTLSVERFVLRCLYNKGLTLIIGNNDAYADFEWAYDDSRGGTVLSFSLTDIAPAGYDALLNQFFIDNQGNLIQVYENQNEFELATPDLLVQGVDEDTLVINNGFLQNG